MEYKHKQFMARMKLSTYRRLRKHFPAIDRNESAASYFERLSKFLRSIE